MQALSSLWVGCSGRKIYDLDLIMRSVYSLSAIYQLKTIKNWSTDTLFSVVIYSDHRTKEASLNDPRTKREGLVEKWSDQGKLGENAYKVGRG